MSVLITGITGFVGQNLSAYLKSKTNLKILGLNLREEWASQIGSGTRAIVHLAGKAHDLKNVSDQDEYYKVNYELTCSLYDKFLTSEATHFIFISSVKAVADKVEGVLVETDDAHPETDYGKSKLLAEQYILKNALPPGKYRYILRPCMIHGPANKGNLNLLYKFIKKNIPYPLASFNNKRSFLSIENLCFIINGVLDQTIPSGVYNVADDLPLSTNEVVAILAKSLNKKPLLWHIPKQAIYLIAKFGDALKLPLNTETLNKLTENYVVSNKKIKEQLRISMPKSTLEGLETTAISFKS
jgi:nucleoside-diphosphate-sugar epimerase